MAYTGIKCQSQMAYKNRSLAQYSTCCSLYMNKSKTHKYVLKVNSLHCFLCLETVNSNLRESWWSDWIPAPSSMSGRSPFFPIIGAGFNLKGVAFDRWGVTSNTQLTGTLNCTSFTQLASAIHWPKAKSLPVYCCFLFGINQNRWIHTCLVWRQYC